MPHRYPRRRPVSAASTTALDRLRPQFAAFMDTFATHALTRDDFALHFMTVYAQYHHETGHPFHAFVRELDATLPSARAEYLQHPSFQAACILRRLVREQRSAPTSRTTPPYTVLAMVLRGVLVRLTPREVDSYWVGLQQTARWRAQDVARLRGRIDRVRPVTLPDVPRLVRHHPTSGALA